MTEPQPKIVPVSDVAIVVNPGDNVAVVKGETHGGLAVQLSDNEIVVLKGEVPPGHRFAVRDIPEANSSGNTASRSELRWGSARVNGSPMRI